MAASPDWIPGLDIRLVGREHPLAGQAGRQAGGVTDHPAGIILLPHTLDDFWIEEQGTFKKWLILAFLPGEEDRPGRPEGDNDVGAVRERVDARVVDQLPEDILGGALPGELPADLDFAQAQVVHRGDHDQPV